MQTTGLASEAIGGLYEGDLAAGLRDARRRTLAIYAHLDLARTAFPRLAIVNPPLWELSHIAWFQEFWCLRQGAQAGAATRLVGSDALFDSRTVSHASRWSLPYPPQATLRAYMQDTLDATLDALARTPEEKRYFFGLALLHEDMHGEALLMSLQSLALPAPDLGAEDPPSAPDAKARDVAFAGGTFALGTERDARGFIFDNEKWAHPVEVAPFAISSLPVTQGEYAAFVEDRGYARPELWSAAGWAWRAAERRTAPRDWRREASDWSVRRFDRWQAVDPSAPMVHVNWHEAQAWCRWAKRRLPSEAEWEFAARNGGEARYPWGDEPQRELRALDYRHSGPSNGLPEPPSASGLRSLLGGVWEWTASPFTPYPGFRADPYREYSEPWFGTHQVLRGGSFATRSRLVHNRWRNFYLPERCDAFAGFRTCALAEGPGVS